MVDWYAVFFEACKDRSPSGAGIDLFGLSYSISLIAIIAGVAVKKTGKYVIPTYIGWAMMVAGAGLLTTLRADSSIAKSVGFQLVIGGGVGIIYVVSLFPILASIPVTQSAPAMALYVFSRNFGYVSLLPWIFSAVTDRSMTRGADLGGYRRRCDLAERAEEETAHLVSRPVPAGRRACLCGDSVDPDARAADEGRGAGDVWRSAQGCMAGRARHRGCGVRVKSRHATASTAHEH
jgi:hypothetical protein